MRTVLIATRTFGKYSQEPVDFLERHGFTVIRAGKEDFYTTLKEVDALIVGIPKITRNMLQGSRVKIIAKHGVGVDNIDVKAATEFGIPVTITYGANSSAVAELVIAFIFALSRRLISTHKEVFEKKSWPNITGIELQNKVLGLLGFGAIAREVSKRACCLGMKVIAHDPYVEDEVIRKSSVEPVEFIELFKTADFVSIHIPLNSGTKNLVGERELNSMKESAFLINTSRGGIVDEIVLGHALKEHWIAGAAVDVFEEEPPNSCSSLFECENLITTSHIGAHTVEAVYRMNMMAAQAVVDFFEGREPFLVVNKEALLK
ncbi:MAG TPA: hydroxyacid dehydrogenase [Candidatus Marinimicrobia bacterium]|nr:hydroxyacid dehydrogenase [Candidatus Neomarinimicrobiota bacterium]